MLPAIRTTEPNSPTARAKLSAAPERIAGTRLGSTTRRKIVTSRAQRRGRLLHLAVELHEHRLDRAHDERQRHEQQRQQDRPASSRCVDADRAVGPTSASRMMPATIVGSAKGRSMSALTPP
jgi:hypothetical protein